MWKWICCDWVATKTRTGIETRPKLIVPELIECAAMDATVPVTRRPVAPGTG
jgi:hypothetical protein